MDSQKQTFPAELEHLHSILIFIQTYGKKKGIPSDLLDKIILGTEEALVNVINYSYPQANGIIEITCQDTPEKPGIKIIIKDQGLPFNPIEQTKKTETPPHKASEQINDLDTAVGGYGIYIFVGIMDRVEYQRTEEGNQLTLTKFLP